MNLNNKEVDLLLDATGGSLLASRAFLMDALRHESPRVVYMEARLVASLGLLCLKLQEAL